MEKEWINKVMKSVESNDKVLPSQDLLDRLYSIPNDQPVKIRPVTWFAAASVAILIIVNIVAAKQYQSNSTNESSFSQTYLNHINDIQL